MGNKRLISVALIIFVLVSAGYLLFGAGTPSNSAEKKITFTGTNFNDSKNTIEKKKSENTDNMLTAEITAAEVWSGSIVAASKDNSKVKDSNSVAPRKGKPDEKNIQIYYFHGARRCYTCRKIEELARKTINKSYAVNLAAGNIIFSTVNFEVQGNRHFIKDFELYASSLVITEKKNGKIIRWKNLTDVWRFVRNETKFSDYVKKEVDAYITGDVDE